MLLIQYSLANVESLEEELLRLGVVAALPKEYPEVVERRSDGDTLWAVHATADRQRFAVERLGTVGVSTPLHREREIAD